MSLVAEKTNPSSKISNVLSKSQSVVGNISSYIISPAMLGLSIGDNDSGILDYFISGVFSSFLESNTRLGVEKKYEFTRDSIKELAKDGVIEIEYSKKENQIY